MHTREEGTTLKTWEDVGAVTWMYTCTDLLTLEHYI